jgi:hypothetical protein
MVLCGLEKKLDLHSLEWEDDSAVVDAVDDPGGKQSSNIAVDSLYITASAPGGLANRHGASATKGLE